MFKTCKISRKTDTKPIQILGRNFICVKTSRSSRRLCRILNARERTRRPCVLRLRDILYANSRRRVDLRRPEESRRVSLDSDTLSRYTLHLDSCTRRARCPSRIYIVSNCPYVIVPFDSVARKEYLSSAMSQLPCHSARHVTPPCEYVT